MAADENQPPETMTSPSECEACANMDMGFSGFCREHKRIGIAEDESPQIKHVLKVLSRHTGIKAVMLTSKGET